ncbi:MAG: hypothetical protein KBD47_01360 [Candidatus Pacebacteria bacterium]|jgi:hypothetical protein|nr:hypothetical protein [Candidatus Paceibacterota bacterium]
MNYFKQTLLSLALIASLLVGAYSAQAAGGQDLFGWAWSSTIGWISFNSANDLSGGGNYKVIMDDTGGLSGYAWSSNIGWIKFDSNVSGCPDGGACTAPRVVLAGPALERGAVTGWARACSGTVTKDCNGASRTDGWDGWIKLSDQVYFRSPRSTGLLGVTYKEPTPPSTVGIFSGFAWGSENVGWTKFYLSTDVFLDDISFNVSCGNPSFVPGTKKPRWTATASQENSPSGEVPKFTYTWTWGRAGTSTVATPEKFTSNVSMIGNATWPGPKVVVSSSISSETRTADCPQMRSTSGGNSISVYCTAKTTTGNRARWEAIASGAIGQVDYTWALPMSSTYTGYAVTSSTGGAYESNEAIPNGGSFAGPTVTVEDDAGYRSTRVCESAVSANPTLGLKVNIKEMGSLEEGKDSLVVEQGATVYSFVDYDQIVSSSCKLSTDLILLSGVANGFPEQLVNKQLNTNQTPGVYALEVFDCDKTTGGKQPKASANITIKRNTKLEEI